MDFWPTHVAAMADHFAALCAIPDFKVSYWKRVKALAEAEPWIYAELPDIVTKLVKERAAKAPTIAEAP